MLFSNTKKIFLFGGVGNHLFKIAHAVELSKLDYKVTLIYLPNKFSFIWKLFGFTVQENWIDIKLIAKEANLSIKMISILDIFFILKVFLLKKAGCDVLFDLKLDCYNKKTPKYILGYFQSKNHLDIKTLEYFAHLVAKQLKISNKLKERNVIHFRAGDFDEAAYIKKDELNKIAGEYKDLIFTTNDRPTLVSYCDFLEFKVNINNSNSALDDFKFMSSSTRLFLSFSTFSFWAGLICKLNGGTIIFPYKDKQLTVFYKNNDLVDLFREICK